jgi:MoxR-like ATPase
MQPTEAYERGLAEIRRIWNRAVEGESAQMPRAVEAAIGLVMEPEAQVSHRYALPTQALLKMVVGDSDARRLTGFDAVDGPFSARSFAKETVVAFAPVGNRLGGSDDPYVSNPLRQERLTDKLLSGKGREGWQALFEVLRHIDEHPEATEAVLLGALARIRDRPEAGPKTPAVHQSAKPVDLTGLALEAAGIEQDQLLDIIEVLESDQPQVILAGPPGTSKTHVAVGIAAYLTGGDENRYRVVQLHASYGYEEFVEGIRPTSVGGMLEFDVVPGAVRRISEGAGDEMRVLVLDEMNRANLPRVLGELLFAIERREQPVDLMYTGAFRLPKRVAFIGTMNTADRSIRSIDAAVRRRFQIFDFPPRASVLRQFYEQVDNEVDDLVAGFEDLNERLTSVLDRHHTIGHTFFMDARGMTASRLRQIWDRQVFPLIEEYLFDQPDLLAGLQLEALWPGVAGS